MSTFVSPQIFLVSLLAGWLNQGQQKILEYLQEENRVLKAQLGQRLGLSDGQRRRLAAKRKELGRKLLAEVATLDRAGYDPPMAVLRKKSIQR